MMDLSLLLQKLYDSTELNQIHNLDVFREAIVTSSVQEILAGIFPRSLDIFKSVGVDLLTGSDVERRRETLQSLLVFSDVQLVLLHGLIQYIKNRLEKAAELPVSVSRNLFHLLYLCPPPHTKGRTFLCQYKGASYGVRKELKAKKLSAVYSESWSMLTKLKLSPAIHQSILSYMPDQCFDHLDQPVLFTDFFIRSYQMGGLFSVSALNGLFMLIHKYNLDYPDFYGQVYNLLQPSVLCSKYRTRFFELLDTFLMSTHLPFGLVAAFAKRLSRLCLFAPADACLYLIKFIRNLLIRHAGIRFLLDGKTTATTDPFDMTEDNPLESKALQSSLWEIATLLSHYCPEVSGEAERLLSDKLGQAEDQISLADNQSLLESELMRELPEDGGITLNFIPPKGGLFGDTFYNTWLI